MLCGGGEAEGFARSGVEGRGDRVESLPIESCQRESLEEILTRQAVGVPAGSSLPGGVQGGKEVLIWHALAICKWLAISFPGRRSASCTAVRGSPSAPPKSARGIARHRRGGWRCLRQGVQKARSGDGLAREMALSRPSRWQKSPNPSPFLRSAANAATSGSSATAIPDCGTRSSSENDSRVPAKSPPTNTA